MVLVEGVEGGGGGGERKEPRVSVCVRARGVLGGLLSQRVALRPSPVAVCEGGREPGSLSSLSPSLSPLSLSSLRLPPSLPLFVCVPVRGCWGRGRERKAGEAAEAGGGGGPGAVGAEVSRTRGRGHLLMIGCQLHGEPEAHAGRRCPAQILSSPEEPRFPARLLLALPPRAWLSGSAAQHRGLLIIFFYSRR